MKKRILTPIFLLCSIPVFAGQENPGSAPSPPPPPPEVNRTVGAVVGRWSGWMTAKIPGGATEKFPWSMNCKAAALGAGASCTMEGHASIGDMAQACIVAYDPEGKAVHYMCVTSMGEVHDHRGRWRDATTIEFEPLSGGLQGTPMTETITWTFADPGRMTTRSVVTLQDGSAMTFEFDGRRD